MTELEVLESRDDPGGLHIGIAVSRFNASVTDGLLAGAESWLTEVGVGRVTVVPVDGAFELPLLCAALAERCDAVIALGAVIEGKTDHYEHVAHRASEGLMAVMLESRVPVAFGVLTTRDGGSAVERSRPGPGNKGAEAAAAAVQAALMLRAVTG